MPHTVCAVFPRVVQINLTKIVLVCPYLVDEISSLFDIFQVQRQLLILLCQDLHHSLLLLFVVIVAVETQAAQPPLARVQQVHFHRMLFQEGKIIIHFTGYSIMACQIRCNLFFNDFIKDPY